MERKRTWNELWKLALKLEKEIDQKLLQFNKMGNGHRSTGAGKGDTEALLGTDEKFEELSSEIQRLLDELSTVSDEMAELPLASGERSELVHHHTIQRLQEILCSYQTEYKKTEKMYLARKDREDLFGYNQADVSSDQRKGLNRRMEYVFKEQEHLQSSSRLVDEQISIAMETRDHLGNQRVFLKRAQTRLRDIAHRFPTLTSIIQQINNREIRNNVILGSVVIFCFLLLLAYVFY